MNIPNEFKNLILNTAPKHLVKAVAPSTFQDVWNSPSLVVWNGASDNTIWNDPTVNYAFRALHDALHIETRIGFSPKEEIEIGRIQAAKYQSYSVLFSDLVYIETAGQAEHYLKTGQFVEDQIRFTMEQLNKLGYKLKF